MRLNVNKALVFLLVILVYVSNPPWFLWGINYYILSVVIVLLSVLAFLSKKKISHMFVRAAPVVAASFAFFALIKGASEAGPRATTILLFMTYISLFFVTDASKEKAFVLLSKSLAALVFISGVFWLVHTYIVQMPFYFPLAYSDALGKGEGLTVGNYIFFIQPEVDYVRFYSVFDEPGTLGVLCAMVLYGCKYNLKDRGNVALLVGGIFTFSLAFYIITLFGVFVYLILDRRIKQILIFLMVIIFSGLFLYSSDSFNSLIVGRVLNFDQSFSQRSGYYLDQYFSSFMSGPQFLYGESLSFLSKNSYLLEGQSYKFFFLEYGLIGFSLMLLLYIFMIDMRRLNAYVFSFFVLFLISFMQRPFMFTSWQIVLFSITLPVLYKEKTAVSGR